MPVKATTKHPFQASFALHQDLGSPILVHARQVSQNPPTANPQLFVRRLEVDHPIPQRLADPNHRSR